MSLQTVSPLLSDFNRDRDLLDTATRFRRSLWNDSEAKSLLGQTEQSRTQHYQRLIASW
jgi:hypothetical protein